MVMEQVQGVKDYNLLLRELQNLVHDIAGNDFPTHSQGSSPIEVCQAIGEWYVKHSDEAKRHDAGQFFTPPIVARYMTNLAGTLHDNARVLDPGAGVGILACAICEPDKLGKLPGLSIVAYESDPVLHIRSSLTLNYARNFLQEHASERVIELYQQDFTAAMAEQVTQV